MEHKFEISPKEAEKLIEADKAVLVDVRELDEIARLAIKGAKVAPLSGLRVRGLRDVDASSTAIFFCRSGQRTAMNAHLLDTVHTGEVRLLKGGLLAWQASGLPVIANAKAPLEIMRQVQIVAGLLILSGVLLGIFVAPGFFGLSAFVGLGLTFAGVTGWCGMAKLLSFMPWNKKTTIPA